MNSNYFTPQGLADLYGIPKTTIWKWIREGEFRGALKMRKHYRISNESRLEFEKKHEVK